MTSTEEKIKSLDYRIKKVNQDISQLEQTCNTNSIFKYQFLNKFICCLIKII